MHWLKHHAHSPHELPHECQAAGADWTPNIPAYDINLGPWEQCHSDEQKEEQRDAGAKLLTDLRQALGAGSKEFTIPPGVYRMQEPLVIADTQDFTLLAHDVELLLEGDCPNHFRILNNTNLVVKGPLMMDNDPMAFTQGTILGANAEELTIDVRIMDDYAIPTSGDRIEIFSPEGVMLPHGQDPIQGFEDLGDRVVRLKMNHFTFDQHKDFPDEIIKPGNLIVVEIKGRGGPEIRENNGMYWVDVSLCCAALAWAMPEYGEDKFERWYGSRRRGTNRLIGGGFFLMTFQGGSFVLIDSEVGHNMDDMTDIPTPLTFAFGQVGPQQFYIMDNFVKKGDSVSLYDYATMEPVGEGLQILELVEADNDDIKSQFKELCERRNVINLHRPMLATVDRDVSVPELCYTRVAGNEAKKMVFIHNYVHDGLAAGINPKGADEVIIRNNIVERVAGYGIAVGFDPYWWEGNPSKNIEISGNTVRNCPYAPNNPQPSIAVYVGGSHNGQPGPQGTGQLQQGVNISNNLVLNSGGAGISVTNTRDISITDNVLVDTDLHDLGKGSIYFNAVAEGVRVSGNVFVSKDASPDVAQIRTGVHTSTHCIVVDSNRTADSNSTVPDAAWDFHAHDHPAISYYGEGWWVGNDFPHQVQINGAAQATVELRFTGAQVRALGTRAPSSGLADVFIDDKYLTTLDNSRPQDSIGPLFMSPILPEGEHTVKLVCRGERGVHSNDQWLSVHGFDVLPRCSAHCQWDPRLT